MHVLPITSKDVEDRLLKIDSLSSNLVIYTAIHDESNSLVRVDINYSIENGSEIKFKAPVNCSEVTGLIVCYPDANQEIVSREFAFADANGNNVGNIDYLFAENAVVKVILDTDTNMAFVQNADTNAYIETQLANLRTYVDEQGADVVQFITWEADD
jgi:hypothetical protein